MSRHMVFPVYTRAERLADRVIHVIGVPLGFAAAAALVLRVHGGALLFVSVAIYAVGLVGMLASSAAYQLSAPGLLKEHLRRVDRAFIFIMIAGTYTPISANVLAGKGGLLLCGFLWLLAATGIFLTLRYPRRFEKTLFALYLAMGWMLIISMRQCFEVLALPVMGLIIAGGLAYTTGAVVQSFRNLKFNNPIWHALVLLAACLQYAAISLQFTGAVV